MGRALVDGQIRWTDRTAVRGCGDASGVRCSSSANFTQEFSPSHGPVRVMPEGGCVRKEERRPSRKPGKTPSVPGRQTRPPSADLGQVSGVIFRG